MTLDEAIIHFEEKAKGFDEFAREQRQLAVWLIDYKHRLLADIIPVKFAYWIQVGDFLDGEYQCSNCTDHVYSYSCLRYRFCPNCGVRMGGREPDADSMDEYEVDESEENHEEK